MKLQKWMIVTAIGAVALLASGSQANAFWWRHGSSGSWGSHGSSGSWGSHGSSGSWGSHGSSGSWGSHGSSGSWGSHGGLFHRHHHSSGSWGSHGSSGSWGSYGSSGGYVSYGSSGGSYGSSGGYSTGYGLGSYDLGAPVGAPVQGPAAPAAPANNPMGPMGDALPAPEARNGTSATLFVSVPEDAKVWVNDRLTTSTGADRRYMSSGLENGRTYSYTIRVEVQRDGRTVSETKVVKVQAGEASQLAFNLSDDSIRTALILEVPADAKVFLAGKETKATGPVREFATTRLTKGSEWASYPVRVEVTRNGETLTKEENISLAAGETREVIIDFDAPRVADLRQ